MLIIVKLSINVLNVVMLNVVRHSVVAPLLVSHETLGPGALLENGWARFILNFYR